MKENPINDIIKTSLENMGIMINVNKVIGEPILLPNNAIAIPISKVVCGYGAAGSEYDNNKKKYETSKELYPFGGGSGGGLTMTPTALIIIKDDKVKLLSIEKENDLLDKVVDLVKDIIKKKRWKYFHLYFLLV